MRVRVGVSIQRLHILGELNIPDIYYSGGVMDEHLTRTVSLDVYEEELFSLRTAAPSVGSLGV